MEEKLNFFIAKGADAEKIRSWFARHPMMNLLTKEQIIETCNTLEDNNISFINDYRLPNANLIAFKPEEVIENLEYLQRNFGKSGRVA